MVELTNRIRGVLMGHGPDALREVFEDESADRALQELTVAQLADRLDGLGLAGVSDEALLRLVRRMDASNDGIVTYAEFSSYLQQRKFAGQVTRILRTAARALAAQGVTLQEVLELTALRAGSADLMRPHSEVPAILHPALLRHLLLTVLGVPLSQAHFTAVAAMADLDGNGDVDVEEVRRAGGGGGGGHAPADIAHRSHPLRPGRLQVLACAGEAYSLAVGEEVRDLYAHEVLDGESAIVGFPREVTNPDPPAPTPAPAPPPAEPSPRPAVEAPAPAPVPAPAPPPAPTSPTFRVVARSPVDPWWGPAAGVTYTSMRLTRPPCHPLTGATLYRHPPHTAFMGAPPLVALWQRVDAVAANTSRLPATAWPILVEAVFVAMAAAGVVPVPPGAPLTAAATAIAGPVRGATPPAPVAASAFAGRLSATLTMDLRRTPQALAVLGLAIPWTLVDFLTRKYDNGTGVIAVDGFARIVDEVYRTHWWEAGRGGLFPLCEARLRQALADLPGERGSPALTTATSDSWPVASTQLVHRHTLAHAIATRCPAAGVTMDEALCLAAWVPGSHQALASACSMKAVVSLIRHSRLPIEAAERWGVVLPASVLAEAGTPPMPPTPPRRHSVDFTLPTAGGGVVETKADDHPTVIVPGGGGGGSGGVSATATPLPTAGSDGTMVVHTQTGSSGTVVVGGSGGAGGAGGAPFILPLPTTGGGGGRRGSAGSVASTVAGGGKVPPPATIVSLAIANSTPTPDVSVDAFISWLRMLAAAGACVESVASLELPAPTNPTAPGASTPAVGSGGATPRGPVTTPPTPAGSPHQHATTVEIVASANAFAYAVLPPLARSAARKLCSLALASPLPLSTLQHALASAAPAPSVGTVPPMPGGVALPGLPPRAPSMPAVGQGSMFALGAHGPNGGDVGHGVALMGVSSSLVQLVHAARLPISFQPSRLAPLAFAHAAATLGAALLDGGWEADPGGAALSRTGPGSLAVAAQRRTSSFAIPASPAAGASAAAGAGGGGVTGSAFLVRGDRTTSAFNLASPTDTYASGSGTPSGGGAPPPLMSPSLAYDASAAAPSLLLPPGGDRYLGAAHASAVDGYGLTLRLASLLPGAPPRRGGWLSGFSSPTASPTGSDVSVPRMRPIGGGASTSDAAWAGDGALVRPNQATVVLEVAGLAGVPCPPDDAVRGAIVARIVRVAVIDMLATDAAKPPRMRLLSNTAAIVARWDLAREDEWLVPPDSPVPSSRLVVRCDGPRDRGGPAAALVLVEANIVVARQAAAVSTLPPGSSGTTDRAAATLGDGYAYEEVTCAWGLLPLMTLVNQPTTHRVKMMGGSPGAPMDIAPADILQNRSGWRAMAKAMAGLRTVPEVTLVSRPLSRLQAVERQTLGCLPLTCVLPYSQVALVAGWRAALAHVALQRTKSHKPASRAPVTAPPLRALIVAARIVATGGEASASALAALGKAFDVEWAAAQRRRPPPSRDTVAVELLQRCLVATQVANVGLGSAPSPLAPLSPPSLDPSFAAVVTRWVGAPPAASLSSPDLVFRPAAVADGLV
jgi:hypothetical protein